MTLVDRIMTPNRVAAAWLDRLQPLAALAARWYVSWQFLKSGWLKLNSWDGTIYLFENEYHTPVLSPHVAAVAGTFGELFFPSLLVLGFMSRFAALGLFAVNAMAVISYTDVLLADGWAGALIAPHILWGTILVFLIVYGPGPWSLDRLVREAATK
jgi:putative oxidoreductase